MDAMVASGSYLRQALVLAVLVLAGLAGGGLIAVFGACTLL